MVVEKILDNYSQMNLYRNSYSVLGRVPRASFNCRSFCRFSSSSSFLLSNDDIFILNYSMYKNKREKSVVLYDLIMLVLER